MYSSIPKGEIYVEVTSVRVKLAHNKNGKVNPKAFVTIVIDNWLAIRDMRIIQGKERLFVAMPNRKKGGEIKASDETVTNPEVLEEERLDIVYPINQDGRKMIEDAVLAEYEKVLNEGSNE